MPATRRPDHRRPPTTTVCTYCTYRITFALLSGMMTINMDQTAGLGRTPRGIPTTYNLLVVGQSDDDPRGPSSVVPPLHPVHAPLVRTSRSHIYLLFHRQCVCQYHRRPSYEEVRGPPPPRRRRRRRGPCISAFHAARVVHLARDDRFWPFRRRGCLSQLEYEYTRLRNIRRRRSALGTRMGTRHRRLPTCITATQSTASSISWTLGCSTARSTPRRLARRD